MSGMVMGGYAAEGTKVSSDKAYYLKDQASAVIPGNLEVVGNETVGGNLAVAGDLTITGTSTFNDPVEAEDVINLRYGTGGAIVATLDGTQGGDTSLRITTFPLALPPPTGGRGDMDALVAGHINLTAGTQDSTSEINATAPGDVSITSGTSGTGGITLTAASAGADGSITLDAHNSVNINCGIDGGVSPNRALNVTTTLEDVGIQMTNSAGVDTRLNVSAYTTAGGYNTISQVGDASIIFGTVDGLDGGSQGFVLAPWQDPTLASSGMRMDKYGVASFPAGLRSQGALAENITGQYTLPIAFPEDPAAFILHAAQTDGTEYFLANGMYIPGNGTGQVALCNGNTVYGTVGQWDGVNSPPELFIEATGLGGGTRSFIWSITFLL